MRTLLVLAIVASIGCGSGEDPDAGGAGMDAGLDAGARDAATPPDAPVDAARGRLYAFASIERWTRGTERTATMGAIPVFHRDGPAPRYLRVDDRCLVHYEDDWTGSGLTPPSFGTITIEGVVGGPVTWEGGGFDVSPDGFDRGDVLTLRSTGGDVPPFEFTGTVPDVPVLTSHDNTGPGPDVIHVRRDAAFALTWEPTDGEIFVLFLQFDHPDFTMRRGIHCFFPASAGAEEIPVAALAELLPTSSEIRTSNFYFGLVHRDRAESAQIDVDFLLWNARQTRVTVD